MNSKTGKMMYDRQRDEMVFMNMNVNEWIPCTEKLPEPWTSVLITFSGEYGSLTADHAVSTGSYDGLNGWFIDEIQGYTDRLTVEAWMPLPEPYKGRKMHE